MKKVFLFSLFLVLGLVLSQCLPVWLGEAFLTAEKVAKTLMFVCLAFIMINVGREFELDKTKWRSYAADYFIAMATAAVPWIMVAFYYMFLLPADLFGNWDAWKENLLLSRFAAPTSAGILFTMLAAAGLRREWIYKKTQVLAIFDDLDTILLMIPLQIFMIGFKWQLFAVVIVITFLLVIGWKKLGTIRLSQTWKSILFYAVCIVAVTESIYLLTKWMIARSYQEMDDLDTAYEHYQELAGDLKDNPEFLEHYIYLLRELGYFEEAKVNAQAYLKLVPDDVQMQELYERLQE